MQKIHGLFSVITLLLTLVGIAPQARGASLIRKVQPVRLSSRGLFLTPSAPIQYQQQGGTKSTAVPKTEIATFAAGCFWGVEQEFRKLKGVVATAVGYTGGHTQNPTYQEVCTGTTGHAEAVQIEYDPALLSYTELLDLFWHLHDPTTPNRQGPDVGSQYRSAIFYQDEKQKAEALRTRNELKKSGELDAEIVTEIVPSAPFTQAEGYHQQYVEKGGIAGCHFRRKK